MRSAILLLLSVPFIAAQSRVFPGVNSQLPVTPQCPNGEHPKLDKSGFPIQCLPGAGQHSVCGAVHTCYFSGMNYMCCPTNEPPADAQPICPNGLMTVMDYHNHVVRCYPGRKACPAGGQLCLHTGREREHVCCEKFLERPQAPPPRRQPSPNVQDETARVSCPANSLSVLNANGNTLPCSALEPCPGAGHFCFGTTKRAICCQQKIARKISRPTHMIDHDSGHPHHASNFEEKAVEEEVRESIEKGIKRKIVKDDGKKGKMEQFLSEVQSEEREEESKRTTVKRRVKKVRRTTTPATTSTTTTTVSPDEFEYYYVDENGNEETTTKSTTTTTTTEAPRRRIKKVRKITTTTSTVAPEKTEEGDDESKEEKSTESGEKTVQQVEENEITEPQFARPRAKAAKTLTGPSRPTAMEKRAMAQHFIMRHIRNGWPYNDSYYRSDTAEPSEVVPEVASGPEGPFVQ